MNSSKPLWEVERDLVKGVQNGFIHADNGQQCASMFDELDKSNPDIHEYINLIQGVTGNDRYFCMLNSYTAITRRSVPPHLWRGNVKSDIQSIAMMPTNSIRQSQSVRLCVISVDKNIRMCQKSRQQKSR